MQGKKKKEGKGGKYGHSSFFQLGAFLAKSKIKPDISWLQHTVYVLFFSYNKSLEVRELLLSIPGSVTSGSESLSFSCLSVLVTR